MYDTKRSGFLEDAIASLAPEVHGKTIKSATIA